MKKLLIFLIVSILIFTLNGCGNKTKSNTIVNAELTDREVGIISTASDKSFVFDFNIESEYKEVAVWVEKYEFGKLVNDQMGYLTTEIENNGSIILTNTRSNNMENENLFNLGINSNGVTGSSTVSDIVSTKGTDDSSILWGNPTEEMNITNDAMVLASIAFSWDKNIASTFSFEFYKDVDQQISELEKHEVVYLLRSLFMK